MDRRLCQAAWRYGAAIAAWKGIAMQKHRKKRLTKAEWQALGGLANGDLYRKQSKGGAWRYFLTLDNRGLSDER